MNHCEKCQHKLCAKKVPIFSFLSDDEIREIVSKTVNRHYKKGEVICFEDEISNSLYIINDGRVKLTKLTKDGKEQIVHILTTGDFFGELALFTENTRNNFSVIAITDVRLCILGKVSMDNIIMKNPKISLKILNGVAKKLCEVENLAQTLATNDIEIRLANMIIDFQSKFGVKTPNGIMIHCPITREEMANYAGVSRETISRKLRKFTDLGIIELKGTKTILIKDELMLKQFIQ